MAGNPLCHFELCVNDIDKAQAFFSKIFDWSFEKWEGPVRYDMVKTGAEPGGGMMKKTDEMPHACLSVYFDVDDIDATLKKAEGAGATIVVPKMEIPDMGWHGMFTDPEGIPVGVFQAKK